MMPEKVDRPAWEGVIDWPVRDRAFFEESMWGNPKRVKQMSSS